MSEPGNAPTIVPGGTTRAAPAARLTVVEQVCHRPADAGPASFASGFSCALETSEQPLLGRRVTVGEQWQPLEAHWLADSGASQVVLVNLEGDFSQRAPTPEERLEASLRIVEVGFADDQAAPQGPRRRLTAFDPPREAPRGPAPRVVLRPGRSCRFEPWCLNDLRLRCAKGEARVEVNVIPR